jgi:hypothetical protein
LHDPGIQVSYFAVWIIVDRAGLSVNKACTPANRSARRLLADACDGNSARVMLIRSVLFS